MSYGGAGGLYSVGWVVLWVGFARVTNEPNVLPQRCKTPAFGQGSCAVLLVCLISKALMGQSVFHAT